MRTELTRRVATAPGRSRAFACAAALLLGGAACASPARYVVVCDGCSGPRSWIPGQRLIWLAPDDARASAPVLGLRTKSKVQEYDQARNGELGPIEKILRAVINDRYEEAEQILYTCSGEIPAYLRLLVAADLASERSLSATALSDMYQEAYDAQGSEWARNIVKLRIRQLRYMR